MGNPKKPKVPSRRQQLLEAEKFVRTRTGSTRTSLSKNAFKGEEESPYNIDSKDNSRAEIPTLTRLLNRKKYVWGKKPGAPEREPEVPLVSELEPAEPLTANSDLAGEISVATLERSLIVEKDREPETVQAGPGTDAVIEPPTRQDRPVVSSVVKPVVQIPVGVRLSGRTDRSRTQQALVFWSPDQLRSAKDPLGQGISALFSKGAESTLFLCLSPLRPGSRVPEFVATALSGDKSRRGLWTGLRWNPELFPELWNTFVRNGLLELAPPSAATNEMSHRSLLRSAFGLKPDEFLLLLRAGPLNACRGVVAVISRMSLVPSVADALALMTQKIPAPVSKASKAA